MDVHLSSLVYTAFNRLRTEGWPIAFLAFDTKCNLIMINNCLRTEVWSIAFIAFDTKCKLIIINIATPGWPILSARVFVVQSFEQFSIVTLQTYPTGLDFSPKSQINRLHFQVQNDYRALAALSLFSMISSH